MSVFKCKMCGGEIEFEQGATVGTCKYCGTKQTLPKLDDDRRTNLYDRASHFRRSNDFDKAASIYEQILTEDTTDAEAYWSLVLCRYGIEYVEDPATHKRVPTVNRAQFTSIFDDDNYKSALRYADGYQRELYEEEAGQINEIQKGILAISQNEEPFDVFICYKETDNNGRRTPDSVLANDLYYQLKQEGFKVFFARITLEDKLGTAYEPYIFAALNSAKVMVVLGTKPEYFNAVWVKNEWSRYLALVKNSGGRKILIPAYKDMDPYDLPDEFSHLQAQDMSKLGFMQDLLRGIRKIVKADEPKAAVKETVVIGGGANVAPLLKRAFLSLEDGEWEKADEFCEQVLNQDPENAEAYIGKLMAELHVHRREELADCERPFDSSSNFIKAVRFGNEKTKSELNGYIAHINERNETARLTGIYDTAVSAMNAAKTEAACKAAAEIFKTIPGFKDADALAEQCLDKVEICNKEAVYAYAKSKMSEAVHGSQKNKNSKSYYEEAIKLFKTIPGFKDADELAEQCAGKAKDAVYSSALDRMKWNTVADCESAINLFKTISGWKDADEQINVCREKIEKIKAETEKRREAAEKAKKKRKKIAAIVIPIVVACIAFVIVLITVIIPNARYNSAVDLYNAGKYDEAIAAFTALNGYKDSAEQITKCENAVKDVKYNDALDLYNSEKYNEAIAAFRALNGYKDSSEQIAKCETVIKDSKYNAAVELYNTGKYDEAITAFQSLNGYKDSSEQIAKCETVIKDSKYNAAVELYNAGKYDEAITAFKALNGYKDSATQITKCETGIKDAKYNSAVELYNAGKYDEAITAFKALNGYKDSATQITKCETGIKDAKYNSAVELYNAGKYEDAYKAFNSLKYKDSADKAAECLFLKQKAGLANVKAGSYIKFGFYEQDNNTSNGKEEIEWKVLAVEGNKALIISQYALDYQKYNSNSTYTNTTWENCTLRTWLNGTFYNAAFGADHQKMIASSTVTADKNPSYSTLPGNNTTDKVFLLSITEANKYFKSDEARQCAPTDYAIAQGAITSDRYETGGRATCRWWLRSPGSDSCFTADVFYNGSFTIGGIGVITNDAVRPAMWISLE